MSYVIDVIDEHDWDGDFASSWLSRQNICPTAAGNPVFGLLYKAGQKIFMKFPGTSAIRNKWGLLLQKLSNCNEIFNIGQYKHNNMNYYCILNEIN